MRKRSPKELADLSKFIENMIDEASKEELAECEQTLHDPSSQLATRSERLQVIRIASYGDREMTAAVDTSHCDVESLVDKMVAVRTSLGVRVYWLGLLDDIYLLLPFEPNQTIRRLRSEGEGSIAGLVRWIGNEAAPAVSRPDEDRCARTISIQSGFRKRKTPQSMSGSASMQLRDAMREVFRTSKPI